MAKACSSFYFVSDRRLIIQIHMFITAEWPLTVHVSLPRLFLMHSFFCSQVFSLWLIHLSFSFHFRRTVRCVSVVHLIRFLFLSIRTTLLNVCLGCEFSCGCVSPVISVLISSTNPEACLAFEPPAINSLGANTFEPSFPWLVKATMGACCAYVWVCLRAYWMLWLWFAVRTKSFFKTLDFLWFHLACVLILAHSFPPQLSPHFQRWDCFQWLLLTSSMLSGETPLHLGVSPP